MARSLDVLIWGATGFTGRLVAEYLAAHAPKGLTWALGGRSREKLEGIRSSLGPAHQDLPLVIGDAGDPASLAKFVPTVKAIATTVGPFGKYGRELAAACAKAGTHYCDLTGESPFVRHLIDTHHEEAKASGAKLIPCSGFDSIPSDLGAFMLQEFFFATHAKPAEEIRLTVHRMSGGISGGTIASALLLAEQAVADKSLRRILGDPYGLVPGEPRGPDRGDQMGVEWSTQFNTWTAPFVMASINTRVVRRTNHLLGYKWGRDFRYSESMSRGKGPKGWARAAGLAGGLGAFFAAAATRPGRALLGKLLPKPGEGPSQGAREHGSFTIKLWGKAGDAQAEATVVGVQDPGYGETAKMLGESVLCLVEDDAKLPKQGGVLTPASALGMTLIERLRRAGMTWDVKAR